MSQSLSSEIPLKNGISPDLQYGGGQNDSIDSKHDKQGNNIRRSQTKSRSRTTSQDENDIIVSRFSDLTKKLNPFRLRLLSNRV